MEKVLKEGTTGSKVRLDLELWHKVSQYGGAESDKKARDFRELPVGEPDKGQVEHSLECQALNCVIDMEPSMSALKYLCDLINRSYYLNLFYYLELLPLTFCVCILNKSKTH